MSVHAHVLAHSQRAGLPPFRSILRLPRALEMPEELATTQVSGPRRFLLGRVLRVMLRQGTGSHTAADMHSWGLLHVQGAGLDPNLGSCAASHMAPLGKLTGRGSVSKSGHHDPEGTPGL